MASIDTNNGKSNGKKNKPKKQILRVDFTPMVDMNMLLITFFMFCTTLSIPQVMDIAMPSNDKPPVDGPITPASKTFTVLLGENNKVYYYIGQPDYSNYTSLVETDVQGFRSILLERNSDSYNKIKELRQQRQKKQITEADFQKQVSDIKKEKGGLTVLIKPTKESVYKNLVDVLDEMQICGIGRYAILEVEEGDKYMIDNYKSKGELTAERLPG
jgi:biopolymer transport protein ExbD